MIKTTKIDCNKTLDGDASDYIPLWEALGRLRSKNNLDDGVRINESFLKDIKPDFLWSWPLVTIAQLAFGIIATSALIVLLTPVHPEKSDIALNILLIGTFGFLVLQIWRRISQYGAQFYPIKALKVPHELDPIFEHALDHLQLVDGPKVVYRPAIGGKRKSLDNSLFFSKLRYLLFSRRKHDRGLVVHVDSAIAVHSDLYIHREDFEKMRLPKSPPRNGKRGRPVEHPYELWAAAVMQNPLIKEMDLEKEDEAIKTIKRLLTARAKEDGDVDGKSPGSEKLQTTAQEVLAKLKQRARKKNARIIGQLSPLRWSKFIGNCLQLSRK